MSRVCAPPPPPPQLYARWKAELIRTERILLKELGFALYQLTEHPHRCILYYARALGCSREVAQLAWSLLNDSLRLTLCVRYHAESIACAAIYLAARMLVVALPREVPWYEIFNTRREDMLAIAEEILGLYELPRTTWVPSLRLAARAGEDDDEGEPAPAAASAEAAPERAAATGRGYLLEDDTPMLDVAGRREPHATSADASC